MKNIDTLASQAVRLLSAIALILAGFYLLLGPNIVSQAADTSKYRAQFIESGDLIRSSGWRD